MAPIELINMSVEIVREIKAALEERGVKLEGPCGAFEITSRVAWFLRGESWGLVSKTGGNGCLFNGVLYSGDAIMLPDGTTIDVLINSETDNIPAWNRTGPQNPDRWRAPFIRNMPLPPEPEPELTVEKAFQILLDRLDQIIESNKRIETILEPYRR